MYGQDGGDPMRKAIKWISAHAVVSLCVAIIALLVLSTLAFNLMFDQTLDAIDSQSNHLGNILYTQIRSELDSVLKKMESKQYDVAIILNHPSLKSIWDLAAIGKRMPKKTTFFFPKIWSGFVFYRMV